MGFDDCFDSALSCGKSFLFFYCYNSFFHRSYYLYFVSFQCLNPKLYPNPKPQSDAKLYPNPKPQSDPNSYPNPKPQPNPNPYPNPNPNPYPNPNP